jgi:TolA-binding protein
VPQPLYTDEGVGNVRTGVAFRDIEEANILFKDAMMYKKSFSKENRVTAIKRLEKLMEEYPDSDKVDDAAFVIAEIYESGYFGDYESAAKYYIKSYQLNPLIEQPALLKAAEIYERKLADLNKARAIYKQAALYSRDEKSRKKAQRRLSELEKRTAVK